MPFKIEKKKKTTRTVAGSKHAQSPKQKKTLWCAEVFKKAEQVGAQFKNSVKPHRRNQRVFEDLLRNLIVCKKKLVHQVNDRSQWNQWNVRIVNEKTCMSFPFCRTQRRIVSILLKPFRWSRNSLRKREREREEPGYRKKQKYMYLCIVFWQNAQSRTEFQRHFDPIHQRLDLFDERFNSTCLNSLTYFDAPTTKLLCLVSVF